MDLKAEELRLIDLLGENTRIFTTPIFQREYKWVRSNKTLFGTTFQQLIRQ